MNLSDYLSQGRGRATALAKGLGIKPPSVTQWAKGKKPIPRLHGAEIERLTGGLVTRQELFPDQWEQLWPELTPKRRKKAADQPLESQSQ
jgi:DNA-binding transcriptional regulator YdaS (Cro superfamily)